MFFIFGSPRSGTTLLAQCINAHPDIVVPAETDFIIPLAFVFDTVKDPHIGRDLVTSLIVNSQRYGRSIGQYITRKEVREIVYSCDYHPAKIVDSLYHRIAMNSDSLLAGDKSPNDLLRLRILVKTQTVIPDTKIVHIVRDIRDVMISLNEIGWVDDLDLYFPRFWSNSNLYLYSLFKDRHAQYFLVRYEDFVQNPGLWLSRICSFLGVEFTERMTSPRKRDPRYKKVSYHSNLFNPITPNRVGRYKSVLSCSRMVTYEKQAGEALAAFGYALHTCSLLSCGVYYLTRLFRQKQSLGH